MSDAIASADGHLREALNLLRAEEETRVTEFERAMAQLRRRIKAVEAALVASATDGDQVPLPDFGTLAPSQRGVPAPSVSTPETWAAKLRGLSQPEALIQIAEERGGILRTVEAKPILIDAGLVKGKPENVYGHIFQLLKEADRFEKFGFRFEKIGPGTYRLLPAASVATTPSEQEPDDAPVGEPFDFEVGDPPIDNA